MTTLISLIPHYRFRRWLYEYAALTAFRILSRSFSAVVSFHNKEFRPKSDGICVANHTTPIDVVILQMDGTYALVRGRPPGSTSGSCRSTNKGGLMGVIWACNVVERHNIRSITSPVVQCTSFSD